MELPAPGLPRPQVCQPPAVGSVAYVSLSGSQLSQVSRQSGRFKADAPGYLKVSWDSIRGSIDDLFGD